MNSPTLGWEGFGSSGKTENLTPFYQARTAKTCGSAKLNLDRGPKVQELLNPFQVNQTMIPRGSKFYRDYWK